MAEHKINVNIGAKDSASKVVDGLNKKLDKLDGTEIEVPIGADTKKAERDIAGLMSKVDKLDSDAGTILLTSNATEIGNEIGDLIIDIDRLDASDPTVDVKATQINTLKGDLDQIEAKIREVNNVPIEVDTRRATAGIDAVGKSAGSSKSVLANMVGNATQDVGSLAGVAGSAGVAIGQMGEYMVDAAADGDRFSTVVANFAKVAGPIAAIATVLSIVQGVMATNEERARRAAEATKEYGDALADSGNDAVGLADVLRGNTADMREFAGAATETGEIVKEVFSNVPLIGGLLKDAPVDVLQVMNDIGVGFFQLGKAIGGNVRDWDAIHAKLEEFHAQGVITDNQFKQTTRFINEQRDAVKRGEEAQIFQNVALGEANALYDELLTKKEPLSQFPEVWDTLFAAIRNGTLDSQEATDAINRLHTELGIAPSDVLALGMEEINRRQQEATKSADERRKAEKEAADAAVKDFADSTKAAEEYARQLVDAQVAVDDLASSFGQMEIRSEALSSIFDLKDAPLDLAGEVRDITQEIGDLSVAAKDIDLSKALDPSNVNADKLLDAFDKLRPELQQKVVEAFSTGGPEAATKLADSYVEQIFKELGGRLSRDEIRRLTGFDQVDVTLKLAVDAASMANAKAELDILTGVTGENTYTASIKLALATGSISPQAAQILINDALKDAGVKVPAPLQVTGAPAAMAEAAKFARENPVPIASELNTPENIAAMATAVQVLLDRFGVTIPTDVDEQSAANGAMGARNAAQDVLNRSPLYVHIRAIIDRFLPFNDAGGTIGAGGGVVAEKRPEIVNGRYLVTQPTVVPAGTRVTSGARTARILRTRGHRGLKRYDAGGTVVAGPQTLNVNVNASMVGNRFELARAVDKGVRDIRRLRGTRA